MDCQRCLPVLVLLLTSAVVSAAEPPAINPYPRPVLAERTVVQWDFASSPDGWVGRGDCQVAAADGCLRVQSTGEDPMLTSPALKAGPGVRVVLRMRSTARGPGQLFWMAPGGTAPTEAASVRFPVHADGQWHPYEVAVPAESRIHRLRLDPAMAAGDVAIDWLRVEECVAHPLEIEHVQVTGRQLETRVRNHSGDPVTCRFGGHPYQLAAKSAHALVQPLALSPDRPFELLTVRVESPGLPAVSRPVVAINPEATAAWLVLQDGPLTLQVAPDGSGARLLSQGRLVAYLAPLVWRAGVIPALKLVRDGAAIRGTGPDVELLELRVADGQLQYTLRGGDAMEGPVVRVVGTLEQGLLAGVEHLGHGESSSSTLDVHGPEHVRFAPDPMHVTLPLMAAVTDVGAVALTWSDMTLQPVFAAPNFFDGTADQRLALRGRKIEAVLRVGGPFASGERLEGAILWAVRRRGGFPPLPPPPRSLDEQLRLCQAGLTRSACSGGAAGWYHAVIPNGRRMPDQPQFLGDCASTMFRLTGTLPEGGPLVRGGAHLSNDTVYFLTGKAQTWLDTLRGQATAIRERQQQPDGSFRYTGRYREGHFEDTASGHCARPAAQLLEFARYTGDEEALTAGRKTLEYMQRFRTPRGAQVWECPLHSPDIMAAAHLVHAYVRGFELTGAPQYRELAVRWALSGVPFVYQWSNRPVMLYATTPVLCATNYRAPVWIGLPVQWCGLVYADALLDLAPHDQTLDWRQLAHGILLAGEQMQYGDGPSIGCLPDSWVLTEQRPQPYDINPCALASLRLRLAGRQDALAVVTAGRHRVVTPFPAEWRDGRLHVAAVKGVRYQIVIDGQRVVDVTSQGADVLTIE